MTVRNAEMATYPVPTPGPPLPARPQTGGPSARIVALRYGLVPRLQRSGIPQRGGLRRTKVQPIR